MVLKLLVYGGSIWLVVAVVGALVLGRMIRTADEAEVGVDWWSES